MKEATQFPEGEYIAVDVDSGEVLHSSTNANSTREIARKRSRDDRRVALCRLSTEDNTTMWSRITIYHKDDVIKASYRTARA